MTQQPSPYVPPNPYAGGYYGYPADPWREVLRPCRRAAVLQWALGGLSLLCGGCLLLSGLMMRVPQYSEQFQQMFQGQEVPAAGIVVAVAVLSGVVGLVLIGLAFAVYRGSRAGIIAAIVICALALLYAMVNIIVISVTGGTVAGGLPAVACSLILQTVPPLWLLVWLVSALQSAGQLQSAQSQYQAQYWQYLQRQQAYQQHQPQPPGFPPPPPISRPQ